MILPPTLLNHSHDTSVFECGNQTLNEWLKMQALKNQDSGASRTFAICQNHRVIGYYALSTGSVERINVPGQISRNMPNPIPVTVLGRLAIDLEFQSRRFGAHLLKDAILRTLAVSQSIGARAMLVHAISDSAKRFYLRYGFIESPNNPMTLLLSLKNIKPLL